MGAVLFLLQLCRLDLGKLLCLGEKASVGEPGIYARPHAADLWVGRSRCADQHDRGERECGFDLPVRNDGGDTFRVCDRSGDGEPFPCKVLGLQQSEAQPAWIYLCVLLSVLGVFSVLLVRVCHVPIETVVLKLPLIAADGIAFVLVAVAAADLTQSFNEAMDMKRILAQLEESKAQLQKLEEKLKAASAEVMEEYKKRYESMAEDYRRRADEWRQETVFRKEAFLERINQQREQRRGQLVWLGEKAEQLLKEELPSKINEMIGGERAKDLAEIKQNIIQELQKLNSRTDRNYLRIAKHLRRNPTAASKSFNDALEELRKFMDIK